MPRGRARGTDQSRNKQSTRPSRSTSRRGRSSTRSAPTGVVRRSSRIANQSTVPPDTSQSSSSMADVARLNRTAGLSSRVIDHDYARGRNRNQTRRSRTERIEDATERLFATNQRQQDISVHQSSALTSDHSLPDGEEASYAMDVIAQPPSTANPGSTLPIIAVRLREIRPDPSAGHDSVELSHLIAAVNLVGDSPVDPNALTGGRFGSIQPPTSDEADFAGFNCGGMGYFAFRDLGITQQGTFRIRITLIKVDSAAGVAVAQVDTTPIRIC